MKGFRPHQRKSRHHGLRERIRRQRHLVAIRVAAMARLAAAAVMDSADEHSVDRHVARRDLIRRAKARGIESRIVLAELLDGFYGKAAGDFASICGYARSSVDACVGRSSCRPCPPRIELEVAAGLLRHLVRDARDFRLAAVTEGQHALVHAVRVLLDQRERNRGARPIAVVGLVPGISRPDDPVPPLAVARDDAALDGDEPPVHLYESEIEGWRPSVLMRRAYRSSAGRAGAPSGRHQAAP